MKPTHRHEPVDAIPDDAERTSAGFFDGPEGSGVVFEFHSPTQGDFASWAYHGGDEIRHTRRVPIAPATPEPGRGE